MKNVRVYALCAIALLTSLPFSSAVADMYKCTEDGKTVFQDKPCQSSGAAIAVKPASGKASDSAVSAAQDSLAKTKANVSEMERERKKREIAYEIESLERDISGYQRSEDAELAALRRQKNYAKNNLAGATWEQSISTEMQAVTEKYKTKIQVARDQITQLRQDVAEIGKSR